MGSKDTLTVRVNRNDRDTARHIAAAVLGRPARSDAEAFNVVITAQSDDRLAHLAERINAELRVAGVAAALHVAGIAAPDAEWTFSIRTGWGVALPDGTHVPLGHADHAGVFAALERRGVNLGQPEPEESEQN